MLRLCRVTIVKVLFLVLVYVFNFEVYPGPDGKVRNVGVLRPLLANIKDL